MSNAAPSPELAELWSLIERTARECWRLTRPTVLESLETTRTPAVFYDWVETGLDDEISVATFAERDPYSNPRPVARQLATQQTAGWLKAVDGGRYVVPARVRDPVIAATRAGDDAMAGMTTLPAADLDRLATLLGSLAERARAATAPHRWAIDHRLRVADSASPAIGQVRESALDLYARRDDVHLHAWRQHEDDGRRWNAFALLCSGRARFAAEIAAAARYRAYPAEAYEPDIATLLDRGWIEEDPAEPGRYQATATGEALRNEVEQETEAAFAAPFSDVPPAEITELSALLTRFVDATGELRPTA